MCRVSSEPFHCFFLKYGQKTTSYQTLKDSLWKGKKNQSTTERLTLQIIQRREFQNKNDHPLTGIPGQIQSNVICKEKEKGTMRKEQSRRQDFERLNVLLPKLKIQKKISLENLEIQEKKSIQRLNSISQSIR